MGIEDAALCDLTTFKTQIANSESHVEVHGMPDGNIFLTGSIGGILICLSDKACTKPKIFRNPETLTRLLEENKIQNYSIDLSKWALDEVFDPHKLSAEYRKAAKLNSPPITK